ncbi:hypothetical protein D3C77_747440 [compost metagenome]
MKAPALAQHVVGMLVDQVQTATALQLADDRRDEQCAVARVWMTGAGPVLAADQIVRRGEQ